jgi:hypothetical protein
MVSSSNVHSVGRWWSLEVGKIMVGNIVKESISPNNSEI